MTENKKKEIEKIAKEFASGFNGTINSIAGSGWLIVDPLSGYLNFCGYENELQEIQESENQKQVLVIIFKDGTVFVPAGSDLKVNGAKDWMWL